jgi:hypothetical protein
LDPTIRLCGLEVADNEVDLTPTQHLEQYIDAVRNDGNPELWSGLYEACDRRRHEHLGGIDPRADPQFVATVSLQEFHLAFEVAHLRQHQAGSREEHAPGIGRVDPVAAATEEDRAESTLKLLDAARERGLRDPERLRGPLEVAMLGKRDRVSVVAEFKIHGRSSCTKRIEMTTWMHWTHHSLGNTFRAPLQALVSLGLSARQVVSIV